ncbi:MAG: hypothetical protein JXB30_03065 [Anaerolineae bacterium]|nr:hypothetical protein [Anaerolineae bacterium]
MDSPLLRTKFYIPSPRPNLVARPRLVEQLEAGMQRNCRLTLVSGPPGFGKTTLICEWLGDGKRPVVWLSVDEADNDPVRFVNYLIAAFRQVDETIGQATQLALQSPQMPPAQGLITPLINDIAATNASPVLVLDDYHLVSSLPVQQILEFLLEHQPPSMHTIISTREDPPLPLTRMRARGQLAEIRERDLRFTVEEATAFLNQTMALSLSSEAVQALEARTEGWIAGLQLAALAIQKEQDSAENFITAFTGSDRYIMEYLVTEVLERQSEGTREFLYQTALLDTLTADLCDALTGRDDSRQILERLEVSNLFLFPLDHRREWYRYHRLFAEFLRMSLGKEDRKSLHQKAMVWYEEHDFMDQAIHHALAYARLSDDLDSAERLIRLAAETELLDGNLATLQGWLAALPDARVRACGELATYKGWLLVLVNNITQAGEYIEAAETALRQAEATPAQQGKLLVLRAFIATLALQDYERAIALATSALETLADDQLVWQVIAHWVMAESLERTRPITEAIDAFRKAHQVGLALGHHIFATTVEISLALALNTHGLRREAVRVCEEALERYTDSLGRVSPIACLVFSRLGTLAYETNQLELSRHYHKKALELSEKMALGDSLVFSYGLLAPTLYAQGETDAALEALQKAYPIVSRTGYLEADWFLGLEADLRLRLGEIVFVQRWAEAANLTPDDEPQYLHIEQHLVYARLLLAQDQPADAQRWLAALEQLVREHELYRWLISVQVLQALLAERLGEHGTACEYLSQAIQLAAPEGYFRAFLDEDRQIIMLLSEVRHITPGFVDRLIAFARSPGYGQERVTQPLVEPLSERELEVLGLISSGLSNNDIARQLYIAVGTVKRHINNIYGKLDVASRTQAIVKARELHLIDDQRL